ncbi:hypothetical protein T4A_11879 [Trichinella pseudospiralis]|uniref:Uncharacterized protein n=1 Tax=Trichinella pseudospiralis TaxID=6337 RepID=A0A0V1DTP9_TRIPS|nr:hypothetical protein T4A_11879 [Trichinella pseudospiralis]
MQKAMKTDLGLKGITLNWANVAEWNRRVRSNQGDTCTAMRELRCKNQ